MSVTLPESLPISSLNALEYCPRRFYYQYVQSEMLINEFVLEGTLVHQRVHQPGKQVTAEGEIQTTRVYLYSEELRLSGYSDIVEEQEGLIVPVEFKHGHQGNWLNDHIQLCAQALCLEERLANRFEAERPRETGQAQEAGRGLGTGRMYEPRRSKEREQDIGRPQGSPLPIPYGYIFYVGSRRRVQVDFDEELRAKTRAAIAQAFEVATFEKPPPPLEGKLTNRCPNCSLVPLCLPDEVKMLQIKKEDSHANIIPD